MVSLSQKMEWNLSKKRAVILMNQIVEKRQMILKKMADMSSANSVRYLALSLNEEFKYHIAI